MQVFLLALDACHRPIVSRDVPRRLTKFLPKVSQERRKAFSEEMLPSIFRECSIHAAAAIIYKFSVASKK